MSETKPPSASEELGKQLKQSLTSERPKPWKIVLGVLAICTALLGLLGWWFYPRPRLEPLQVVAMDVLAGMEGPVTLRAVLVAPPDEETPRSLAGHPVLFQDPPPLLPQPGVKLHEVRTVSKDAGVVLTEWPAPKTPIGEVLVKQLDPEGRPALDHARIFLIPRDGKLLLVDVDAFLVKGVADEQATEFLAKCAEEGWHIAYAAIGAATVQDYRSTRAELMRTPKLPRAPVLGRISFATQTDDAARQDLLKSLPDAKGDRLALVRTNAAAALARAAGWRAIVVDLDKWKDVSTK
jgi:hypothetical protein